ncbi:helix-turn-helix domain-containing protein [Rhodococcus sp. OK302]|uniref:helix-turn-helix domain-containing protein n=1 Tax=Rhodococcus sp. OK302 TaxID=1882769 RepID=UPI000B943073|nr:helix-turn-helix domain-containing protein [Rhodococcus sp. OK302]OYD69899.1 GAF domain-containing protein [Rhodococcus sp. OK302]
MTVVAETAVTGRRAQCSGIVAVGSAVRAMTELAAAVNNGAAIDEILQLAAAKIAQTTGHMMAIVMQPNSMTKSLEVVTAHGISDSYVDTIMKHPLLTTAGDRGEGPTSRAFRSRRPVVATGLEAHLPIVLGRTALREGIGSMVSLPLLIAHNVRYIVNVYCTDADCFDDATVLLLENFASLVSLLLDTHVASGELYAEAAAHRRQIDALQSKCHSLRATQVNLDELHGLVIKEAGLERLFARLTEMTGASFHVSDVFGRTLAGELKGAGDQHMRRSVVLDNEVVATLSIRCAETDVTVRPEVAGMLHAAPALVAMMLMRSWVALDAEARLRVDLVEELLAGPREGNLALAAHARNKWGIEMTARNRLVVGRIANPSPGASSSHDPSPIRRSLLAVVEELVRRSPGAHLVAEFDRQLVVLLEDGPVQAAGDFGEVLRREVSAHTGGGTVSVAVADASDTVEGHRDSYRHAVALLDLVGESAEPARTVTVEQFGFFRLLLDVKQPRDLVQFADQMLGPLRDYDERRGTDLVETLCMYMDSDCSTGETAKRLHLHHNSVNYRLKSISRILGLSSLSEPKILLRLELALSINRLVQRVDREQLPRLASGNGDIILKEWSSSGK